MSDIAERVKKIVVEHLGVDAEKVTENASFIDDLGSDSLDVVELVMAFEEEFGVEIPDDAAETILTVGDAVKFLEKAANNPYVNVLVTQQKLKDDPRVKKLAEALTSPQIKQYITDTYKGSVLPAQG